MARAANRLGFRRRGEAGCGFLSPLPIDKFILVTYSYSGNGLHVYGNILPNDGIAICSRSAGFLRAVRITHAKTVPRRTPYAVATACTTSLSVGVGFSGKALSFNRTRAFVTNLLTRIGRLCVLQSPGPGLQLYALFNQRVRNL